MNFFQSWAFYFLAGLFIGTMFGFFVAALCASSSKISKKEKEIQRKA